MCGVVGLVLVQGMVRRASRWRVELLKLFEGVSDEVYRMMNLGYVMLYARRK